MPRRDFWSPCLSESFRADAGYFFEERIPPFTACYLATLPCKHGPCPHGKEPPTCQWTEYAQANKCPSSRSLHAIRTGAITYLLNKGWPPEDVAERVNATVKTIEEHYDKADPDERRRRLRDRMERRRRPLVDQLDL